MRTALILALFFLFQFAAKAQAGDEFMVERYNAIGDSLGQISDFKNAILYRKRALNILQSVNPAPFAKLASAHRNIGFYYRQWGKFADSRPYQIRAVEIAEKYLPANHDELARAYNGYGGYFNDLGQYDKSFFWFKKALDIGVRAGHERTGNYYNNVGIAQQNLGQKDSALVTYQRALQYNIAKFGLYDERAADNLINIGTLHNDIGQLELSLVYLDSAAAISDSIFPSGAPQFASLYNNLGAVHTSKGDYRQALSYLEQGLVIYEKNLGSDHPEVANIYANIGLLLMQRGDIDKALNYFKRSHSIREQHFGENLSVARSCVYLGNCFLEKKHYDEAFDWLKKGLFLFSTLPGGDPSDVANVQNDLGRYYEKVENYNEALKQYNAALRINGSKLGSNNPDVANSYLQIGNVYRLEGKYDEAQRFFHLSLHIRLKNYGPVHADVADCYRLLAESCPTDETCLREYIGEAEKALGYKAGETEFDQVSSQLILLKIMQAKGKLLHGLFDQNGKADNLLEADKIYRRAMELVDFIKTALEQPGSRLALQDNFYRVFEDAILVKTKLKTATGDTKYWHEAFEISERSNAILLMEALQAVDAERFAGIPDSLLELERQLKIDLTFLEKQRFEEELKKNGGDPKAVAKLNNRIFQIHERYHDLLTYFRKNHEAYFEMKYAPEAVSISKIQSQLLRPDQSMLAYFVGEENVFAFVISAQAYNMVHIPKDFPLEIWVEEFRHSIASFNPGVQSLEYMNQKYVNIGHELYQLIFKPVEAFLKTKSLVIIPGGMLGYLPFDALLATMPEDYSQFGTHDYLIRHYQISYSYSATLLEEMMESEHKNSSFVAFAPTYFGDTLNMNRSDDPWRTVLGQLRFNEWEVTQIQKQMGGRVFLDSTATEENFLRYAPKAGILHLATHGKSNDRHGDYSYLAFFQLQDSVENELVFVKNLYNLAIPAAMVVLSACETGIGELQRGEGIVSLARGFSYAGAASIVTTMWNIDDQASANIMVDFYRHLKSHLTKDEALRKAKLGYLEKMKGGNRSHPLFWAAYVPVGDMSPLGSAGFPGWGWAVLGLGLLGLVWWVFFE